MEKKAKSLSQEQIVDAAVRLLEQDGFDQFNMRALAAELGVVAGAIYRHAGGKENILAQAADRILDSVKMVGQDRDWRYAFTKNAGEYRKIFKRYPGVAAYLTTHLGETPVRQRAIQTAVDILISAGQSRTEAMRTSAVVNAYIRAGAGDGDAVPRARTGRSSRKSGARSLALDDASFQHGLALLIAGIEASIASARAAGSQQD